MCYNIRLWILNLKAIENKCRTQMSPGMSQKKFIWFRRSTCINIYGTHNLIFDKSRPWNVEDFYLKI